MAPVTVSLGLTLDKQLLTGLHRIGHKHCISVIGWIELIHAGGSLCACLLLLTNLRGKIGIQLVWPELSLSLLLFLSPLFVIQFLGPSLTCSIAILSVLLSFSSPCLFSPNLCPNFLMTAAANLTQRGEWNSISPALGALSLVYYSSLYSRSSSDGHCDLPSLFSPFLFSPSRRYLPCPSPPACSQQ